MALEGNNSAAGGRQLGNGYSTRISRTRAPYPQPPSSLRGASHIGSQDEEAISVTHDIYSVLGGSTKIPTDNGTKFKNEVFKEMLQSLGTEKLIHLPPYRPQSNGRIEGFHHYLKACIAKHMHAGLKWDEVTAMATAAYNHFPNMSAKELAFFLMYG